MLAPPQVQNHCHLNSHILKSHARVRTLLFDYGRAQADTAASDAVPMDLSMLGKGKGEKSENSKGEKDKDKKGKGKANAKESEYFAGYCLLCKAWGHMKKDCWWNESAKSGKETVSLETSITPAANTETEPPNTGVLIQSDEGAAVPANPRKET